MIKKTTTLFYLLIISLASFGQSNPKHQADVKSVDAIVNAFYEVISGPAEKGWDFEKDKYIHSPDAIIVKFNKSGIPGPHSLEAEYIPLLSSERTDFYEVEINRITEVYENIAHVWSTTELRTNPNVASSDRVINSISLYYSDNRWWILSWASQKETGNKIPREYLQTNGLQR